MNALLIALPRVSLLVQSNLNRRRSSGWNRLSRNLHILLGGDLYFHANGLTRCLINVRLTLNFDGALDLKIHLTNWSQVCTACTLDELSKVDISLDRARYGNDVDGFAINSCFACQLC